MSYFIEGVLASHDHARFEVFCYSDAQKADAVTARLRSCADHWRDTAELKYEQHARLVRADGIDLLIDLAGHTARNRLLSFARKPAPAQATYLGYQDTTGLAVMDYRITDAIIDPPGQTDYLHTEKLVRLPRTFAVYKPIDNAPPVGPLGAGKAGFVTFASFAKLEKVTPRMLAVWASVLQAAPGSRMLMIAAGLSGPAVRQRVREAFAAGGVSEDRLELLAWVPYAEYLALHNRVDIALDTFPFVGHTTTCHGLWMGVPIITLVGDRYVSRMGLSVLSNLGLADLAATTPQQFVQTAASLAGDIPRLAALRAGLRDRMLASPLMDYAGFTRELEAAYTGMLSKAPCNLDEG